MTPRATVLLVIILICTASPAAAGRHLKTPEQPRTDDGSVWRETHEVHPGDTLSAIAVRYNVSVERLNSLNPSLNPDSIRVGQEITIDDSRRRVRYLVKGGDSLSSIARRYEVSVKELRRWNPGLTPDRIMVGMGLLVFTAVPASHSVSGGSPNRGWLKHAIRLPTHRAYVIRTRDRAWGTEETISNIAAAFDAVRRKHPLSPRIRIHDLSHRKGGPMQDHKSHQSGRDADLAYFQQSCTNDTCGFRSIDAAHLDTPRQWALLQHWLERDQAEAIFIDYRLQAPLYRYARSQGASKDQLRRWFQYPSGRSHPVGVIRHYPKHHDHLHVRFACHETDPECRTFRPLMRLGRHATR